MGSGVGGGALGSNENVLGVVQLVMNVVASHGWHGSSLSRSWKPYFYDCLFCMIRACWESCFPCVEFMSCHGSGVVVLGALLIRYSANN